MSSTQGSLCAENIGNTIHVNLFILQVFLLPPLSLQNTNLLFVPTDCIASSKASVLDLDYVLRFAPHSIGQIFTVLTYCCGSLTGMQQQPLPCHEFLLHQFLDYRFLHFLLLMITSFCQDETKYVKKFAVWNCTPDIIFKSADYLWICFFISALCSNDNALRFGWN